MHLVFPTNRWYSTYHFKVITSALSDVEKLERPDHSLFGSTIQIISLQVMEVGLRRL